MEVTTPENRKAGVVQQQERAARPVVRAAVERETIRVGVIGTGFGASVHVPALRRVPGVEVVAICGTQPARTREIALELGIPGAFTDHRELFASGAVDAVTIATPPHLHHPLTLAACEAGLHVLVEKPMARNVAEARDMLLLARQEGVCHAVAHHLRHDPARAKVKALVEEGYLGRLHSVSVMVYRSALADPTRRTNDWLIDAARGGGILAAIGSNYVDALRWWFGDVHWVAGAASTTVHERLVSGIDGMRRVDADDTAAFVLRLACGALATVQLCYTATTDIGEEIVATGSEGTVVLHDDKLVGAQRGAPLQRIHLPPGDMPRPGENRNLRPFSILAGEWIWAMRTGTEASPSFEDGVKVQEVVDAVLRSQQLSRWIDLSGTKWPV